MQWFGNQIFHLLEIGYKQCCVYSWLVSSQYLGLHRLNDVLGSAMPLYHMPFQRERETERGHLVGWVHMRFVSPIQRLGFLVIRISEYGNHSTQEIPPEKKYSWDTFGVEILNYFFMMLHQSLQQVRKCKQNAYFLFF